MESAVSYEETEEDFVPWVPEFMKEKQEETYTGASRGTAYHRVMECLDYTKVDEPDQIRRQLRQMTDEKKLTYKEAESVRVKDIWTFVESPLGQRMKNAFQNGSLKREQPFVIARRAEELDPKWQADESILVQGIMDAWFMEGEDIVLADYKTDYVKPDQENMLAEKYRGQLEDYAGALERMTGRKVKERYIYSFCLGKEILL